MKGNHPGKREDELRDEYDPALIRTGIRGKYAAQYREGMKCRKMNAPRITGSLRQRSGHVGMGVDVTLEDENGGILEKLEDSGNCVAKLKAHAATGSSHCLVYIDEYGDTTFNRLQMPRLLEELGEIPRDALDAQTRQFLEQIRGLAEKCIRDVHAYLKFNGD